MDIDPHGDILPQQSGDFGSIGGLEKTQAASGAKEFGDLFNEAIGRVDQYRVKAEESAKWGKLIRDRNIRVT